jgi:hypothetical protein
MRQDLPDLIYIENGHGIDSIPGPPISAQFSGVGQSIIAVLPGKSMI